MKMCKFFKFLDLGENGIYVKQPIPIPDLMDLALIIGSEMQVYEYGRSHHFLWCCDLSIRPMALKSWSTKGGVGVCPI